MQVGLLLNYVLSMRQQFKQWDRFKRRRGHRHNNALGTYCLKDVNSDWSAPRHSSWQPTYPILACFITGWLSISSGLHQPCCHGRCPRQSGQETCEGGRQPSLARCLRLAGSGDVEHLLKHIVAYLGAIYRREVPYW